jgi:hypothetical protein
MHANTINKPRPLQLQGSRSDVHAHTTDMSHVHALTTNMSPLTSFIMLYIQVRSRAIIAEDVSTLGTRCSKCSAVSRADHGQITVALHAQGAAASSVGQQRLPRSCLQSTGDVGVVLHAARQGYMASLCGWELRLDFPE